MDGIDHRWGHRVPVNIPVTVAAQPGVDAGGTLTNVSVSGAWIGMHPAPPEATLLNVGLPSRRDAGGVEYVMAWVVRRTPEGIAVEWADLAPALVRSMLERAQPADLLRLREPPERLDRVG